MFDFLENIDYRTVVNHKNCLHYSSTKSSCNKCVESCNVKAISIEENKIKISEKCINCNICVNTCPKSALVGEKKIFKVIGNTLILSKDIVESKFINTISLDNISKWYLDGIRRIQTNIINYEEFENRINSFNKLLKLNKCELILFEYVDYIESIEDSKYDRAEFFKLGKNTFLDFVYGSIGKKEDISGYFKKILDAFEIIESPFEIKIDDNCTKCNACVRLCHLNSIKNFSEKLEQVNYCNGCMLCRDICPEKSIKLEKKEKIIKIR